MDKQFGRKFTILLVLLVAIVAIVVAGCTTPTPTPETSPMTIVSMVAGEPESLDPAYDYESAGGEIIQNVYETLVYYEGDDVTKPVGVLAKSWEMSEDGLTYTFYLKENVTFHDGTAFNASAVKYSFDRGVIMNLDPWQSCISPLLAGGLDYMNSNQTEADQKAYLDLDSVHVVNETTVQFKLAKPYGAFVPVLSFYAASIISPTYDQAHGGYKANEESEWMTSHMCGTGPYVLTSWDRKDKIVLDKFDNYHGTPAANDRVIIRYVDDWNTRFLAIKNGEADLIYAPTTYADDIKKEPNLVLETGRGTLSVTYIGFNQKEKVFQDQRVRQAFIESFDAESYLKDVCLGYGKRVNGPIPEGLPGFNPDIPYQKFDPEHAKALLQEAGFSKSNPTTIVLNYNEGNDNRKQACLMLKDQIEKYDLGITIDVQELDWPTYTAKNRAGELPIFYLGWLADYPSADNFIGPFCYSEGYYADKVSYKNETIDAIYQEALYETDPAKQAAMYTEITNGVNNDAAYIWSTQAVEFEVHTKQLKGYQWNPMDSHLRYFTMYK
ncbi:ABC transporter substrate-binding protein [Methanocella arvoryzae]|nr:ABC transporter substrate-binding protein [Methanocella arvoryzae]